MNYKVLIAALLAGCVVQPPASLDPLPHKWVVDRNAGQDGLDCKSGVDAKLLRQGQHNLSIACHASVYYSVRQPFEGAPLWGKRVRFSAWVKTSGIDPTDVGGKAGAGLFVDYGAQSQRPVADYMNDSRLTGSTDWQRREFVVDVAPGGTWFNVGLWIRGRGQVWARDLKFEVIGDSVAAQSSLAAPLPLLPLAPMPAGWSQMGNGGPLALPGRCEIGIDRQKSADGPQLYSIRCASNALPSFGGARNTIDSTRYRGKRVRVSAWLMASAIEGVKNPQYASTDGEAGLWLGVGSEGNGVRTDRMQNRALKGSTDWQYRDFVADVPEDNNKMMIGFWMQGKGQLWVRDLTVEEVPMTVPLNFFASDPTHPAGPDLSLE